MVKIRIRSRLVAQPVPDPEDQIFHTVLLSRPPGVIPMLSSVAVHGIGALILLMLAPYLSVYDRDTVDLSRFHVEPLRLTLTEPIFLPVPERSQAPKVKPPPQQGPWTVMRPVQTVHLPPRPGQPPPHSESNCRSRGVSRSRHPLLFSRTSIRGRSHRCRRCHRWHSGPARRRISLSRFQPRKEIKPGRTEEPLAACQTGGDAQLGCAES
jgi:hypothetical protein